MSLPDGRLLLFTFEDSVWTAIIFDPEAHQVDSEVEAPFTGGVRPLGYSAELDRVAMLGFHSDTPHLYLFDPHTGSFDDETVFSAEDITSSSDNHDLAESLGLLSSRKGVLPR